MDDLAFLVEASKGVNGATPLDSPKRQAGKDLCELAMRTASEYGVSLFYLSTSLGLSGGTLSNRAAAHGYTKTPPSIKPYKGQISSGSHKGKGKRQIESRMIWGDDIPTKLKSGIKGITWREGKGWRVQARKNGTILYGSRFHWDLEEAKKEHDQIRARLEAEA
jgi:hypothetical protein